MSIPLPQKFLERMQKRPGMDFPAFLSSYERPPVKGLRVNTLKISAEEFARISPFPLGERVPWTENGFYTLAEKPGADVCHFAGLYYMQEPSAMCAAPLLGAGAGERVLDLCAAPGGKTTQLAADMGGTGIVIANEIDFGRAKILAQNVERMGIRNCMVTKASPARLKEIFPTYFDKILVDAPCSGEGMFKKEPNAVPAWSQENVARCAERQRDILGCAAEMLAEGGSMVYSTCTFAEEEDEWQVEDFLKRHPDFELLCMKKLYPHEVKGEGHFAALLKKTATPSAAHRLVKPYPIHRNAAANKAFFAFGEDFFVRPPEGEITTLADGRMYLVPAGMPDVTGASILRLGVQLGEWDGKLFKPAHALSMAVKREEVRRFIPLARGEAVHYLHGGTLETALENGWCIVGVGDYPLGLGKIVNGAVKNHLPKGLRMIK